jgi:hypothetical protein
MTRREREKLEYAAFQAERLNELRRRIEEARDPAHPHHGEYCWDQGEAAEAARLERANALTPLELEWEVITEIRRPPRTGLCRPQPRLTGLEARPPYKPFERRPSVKTPPGQTN